ncbi:MAG TPA: tetratricopeptide repeat protein, partial [Candidatus Acidoferrales bacterium]|nr:tetratricopeptide repeat protein [Candidatus Acidoferrales bacterium]
LFGDVDGALDLMNMALQSTAPSEVEDAAWILSQIAHLDLSVGKTAEAEKSLQRALTMFPGYHYALGNLAKVRIQQGRYDEAVQLLEQRYQAAPHAENLFDLAEALQLAGRDGDAKKAFAEFEQKSLLESNRGDNSNRELIFYYVDVAHDPLKALEIAQREYARRHDVFTLDAYAWALHMNGRNQEARNQIEQALTVGIRDAKLYRHAGEIALATGDRAAAEKYLKQSAELNTAESRQAVVTLARITSSTQQR